MTMTEKSGTTGPGGAFWLRAVGDESYVNAVEHARERKALVDNHKSIQKSLLSAWTEGTALGDDVPEAREFAASIERILSHGLRGVGSAGRTREATIFAALESAERTVPAPVASVSGDAGSRGRAWIRHALNAGSLIADMRALAADPPRSLYEEWALLLNRDEASVLVGLLELVSQLSFALSLEPPAVQRAMSPEDPEAVKTRRIRRKKTTVVELADEDNPRAIAPVSQPQRTRPRTTQKLSGDPAAGSSPLQEATPTAEDPALTRSEGAVSALSPPPPRINESAGSPESPIKTLAVPPSAPLSEAGSPASAPAGVPKPQGSPKIVPSAPVSSVSSAPTANPQESPPAQQIIPTIPAVQLQETPAVQQVTTAATPAAVAAAPKPGILFAAPPASAPLIVPLSPNKPQTYADSLKETEDRLRSRFEHLKSLAKTSLVRDEFRNLFEAATTSSLRAPDPARKSPDPIVTPPPTQPQPNPEPPKDPAPVVVAAIPAPAPAPAQPKPEPAPELPKVVAPADPFPEPAPAKMPIPATAKPDADPDPEPDSGLIGIPVRLFGQKRPPEESPPPAPAPEPVLAPAPTTPESPAPATSPERPSTPPGEAPEVQDQAKVKMPVNMFQSFIRESIVIEDYDKDDSRRSLYQIAQSRSGSVSTARTTAPSGSAAASSASTPVIVGSSTSPSPSTTSGDTPRTKAPDGWVAPRKQLHFYIQTKGTIKDQDSRCYGCGSAVSEGLFSSPRYCEYTGKFYCTKCHSGKKYYIPARVLHNWDFSMYPVNNFSLEFLTSLYEEPAFDVGVLNPKLYKTVPVLKDLRLVRKKLLHMKDFIMTCTKLSDEDPAKVLLRTCPSHQYTSVEMYSMADLVKVDAVLDKLMGTLESWFNHIASCPLCSAKGSYCEICNKDRPIYPFQLLDVVQCKKCSGVFHRSCFKKGFCPKCRRRESRSIPHAP